MRPNILLIMTDQQRFDQLGFSSGGYYHTPNLDRLARRGCVFENAYTHAPICIPSRGSLMTGLEPHRFPTSVAQALQEGFWTVAHALRQGGYQTMLAGKMHFHPIRARHGFEVMRMAEHLGIVYGPEEFDDYTNWLVSQGKGDWRATHIFGPEEAKQRDQFRHWCQAVPFGYDKFYHPTSWTTREAVEMLEKRDETRPFFLVTSFCHPHQPFDPPAPYDTMYDVADARLPKVDPDVDAGLPPSLRDLMQSPKSFGTALSANLGEDVQRRMATYIRALIRQIDDGVGELLTHVDLENTVVFFTTDHGDYHGHRGRWLKTPGVPFEDIARVPFFCAGAGCNPGRRETGLVQSSDFALTCLELAGIDPPAPTAFGTRSLAPILRGGGSDDHRIVYCDSNYGWPMARRGNLKYFRDTKNGEELLVDLEKDPGETMNVIEMAEYRTGRDELRRELTRILERPIPELPRFDP